MSKKHSSIPILFFIIIFHLVATCSVESNRNLRRTRFNPTQRSTDSHVTNKKFITGVCSYYGKKFHGRKTANGEIFNMYDLTAAHKTLPFGTMLEVENLENNKKVVVRINDRGPFVKSRILDLSYAAAQKIDMIKSGTAKIRAKIINKLE